MSTSNTTVDVPLEFTLRSFRSMRNFAIKSTGCVLIELLTNASDAYKGIENHETMDKTINVRFHHVKIDDANSDNYLIIQDNATGISPEKMRECFLTAGNYTASETSRGFLLAIPAVTGLPVLAECFHFFNFDWSSPSSGFTDAVHSESAFTGSPGLRSNETTRPSTAAPTIDFLVGSSVPTNDSDPARRTFTTLPAVMATADLGFSGFG